MNAKPHKLVSACGAYSSRQADGRNRTDDLLLTRQLLYQLSYVSVVGISFNNCNIFDPSIFFHNQVSAHKELRIGGGG